MRMKDAVKLHQGRVTRVEEPTASLKGRKENESLMLSQCSKTLNGTECSKTLQWKRELQNFKNNLEDDLNQETTSGAQSILGKEKSFVILVFSLTLVIKGLS